MQEQSRPEIPSPCVRNCCLNEQDICVGCLRSMAEILQWSDATDQVKQQILQRTTSRRLKRDTGKALPDNH